ncbi:DUF1579 family protein [Stenotrophomonas sp. Iso1]|uniref:DUF1579 family protein n=1 Tax=Stenotrophomonas sp. Iso1 TaxID=2977283 RepID=UPI0022B7C90E|nr:DUF1579 family protein [Stenotrophomonas sp. Iso1]
MATNRMSRLEVFIGTWNTTGEVLATQGSPATTLSATDTYRWLPGKHFMLHDVDARFGQSPTRSMEIVGYDRASKKYVARSYDDQGGTEVLDVALKGKRWTITGEFVRFQGKFSADSNQLTGLWELKDKKVGWQPWIKLKLERA